jgi:hypothetical protein
VDTIFSGLGLRELRLDALSKLWIKDSVAEIDEIIDLQTHNL